MDVKQNIHYIVTGGAGFIGTNLCEHLLQNGFRVLALITFLRDAKPHKAPSIAPVFLTTRT